MEIDSHQLLASFAERRIEADPPAQAVLDEFIRVGQSLPPEAKTWREIAGLEESWRDTLSDSQVIRSLRALLPKNGTRKPRRRHRNLRNSHSTA
jgi:hypothetical protein